jgi:hypothetical protein
MLSQSFGDIGEDVANEGKIFHDIGYHVKNDNNIGYTVFSKMIQYLRLSLMKMVKI